MNPAHQDLLASIEKDIILIKSDRDILEFAEFSDRFADRLKEAMMLEADNNFFLTFYNADGMWRVTQLLSRYDHMFSMASPMGGLGQSYSVPIRLRDHKHFNSQPREVIQVSQAPGSIVMHKTTKEKPTPPSAVFIAGLFIGALAYCLGGIFA